MYRFPILGYFNTVSIFRAGNFGFGVEYDVHVDARFTMFISGDIPGGGESPPRAVRCPPKKF